MVLNKFPRPNSDLARKIGVILTTRFLFTPLILLFFCHLGISVVTPKAFLLELFYATKKIATFYLSAIADIEFGAEGGYHYRHYQTPPLDRSIYDSNRPINNATD